MLAPYDFSVITSLRLGGERIRVNDSLTSTEIKKLLGVVPSRMKSKNISLSWLCENIPQCDIVAKGARMFMLLFFGTFLCPDIGSTMSLNPWAGCGGYVECEWALELNVHQVLFECGHGRCWSLPLNRPEHTPNIPWPDPIDVDVVEESIWMIGGLQSLAPTQSSQYVLNEAS
ncbi:hypothetical protein SO802_017627 [Lithocarpus litseifolius]|uniref:Uncharacterized protein n=1 Tax=Lithocarpus litseifolius TaxID=425828 RepID=A0AAW2CLH7_9ROSI